MFKSALNVFLLMSGLWGVIIYDISSHGSLESSRTGRVLKDSGLLIHVKPYYTIVEKNVIRWFKWGQKNFPQKEYQLYKNKTIEVTKNLTETAIRMSKDATVFVKKYSVISYDYVVSKIPPDYSERTLKFLSHTYESVSRYTQLSVKYVTDKTVDAKKWLLENVSKDTFTWENMEKVYFDTAHKIGILYTDFTSWVGRKVQCLMSS